MIRFSQSVKLVLYAAAAMVPLLFLPAPFGAETGREIVFGVLAAVAGILWLVEVIALGEIRYPVSPVLWVAGALAAVWLASTLLGLAPHTSAFLADAGAERSAALATGLVFMAVAAGAIKSRGEAGTMLLALIFSGAVAALLTLFTFLVGPIGFLEAEPYFNVIGTLNGLALFYAALFLMAAGLLLSPAADAWKGWIRWAIAAAAAILLADLALIHFRTAWFVILGTGVCLFGFLLIDRSADRQGEASRPRFGWRQWTALGLVLFSIAMIMVPAGTLVNLAVPTEVSPSLRATVAIANGVFREGPVQVFLGSGPGTFGLDWARYKDSSINQTVFWGVRFNQGQSWVSTALPTTGILGFAALVGFLAIVFLVFLRMMLRVSLQTVPDVAPHGIRGTGGIAPSAAEHTLTVGQSSAAERPLVMSAFLGLVSLGIAAFLYPAVPSLMLLFFLMSGVLTALLAVPLPAPDASLANPADFMPTDESAPPTTDLQQPISTTQSPTTDLQPPIIDLPPPRFWDIRVRRMRFETPWVVFVSSLAIIFGVALGMAALYGEAGRVRATIAAERGVRAFTEGKIDEAAALLERAAGIEPSNWRTLRLLVQLRMEKISRIIQEAAGGADVRQEFQSAVSSAIQDSQRMTQAYPHDPTLWRMQGALYEMVIPFIQGSERFATAAYQQATEREPSNPAAYAEWGRAGLVFTDRIAALAGQAQGKDREDLEKARTDNLQQITAIFQRAIQAKPDYAPAHFLLAQTQIRLGNIDSAIQSVENAKLAAPFDIGVAFQLGLIYYQKNNLDRAQLEFERAATLNENYSNARYFLGLIYDRKGDKPKALAEFERIAALNPDNQEVRRVVANLKAGKSALEGIVPPAARPEERREVPVQERERSR